MESDLCYDLEKLKGLVKEYYDNGELEFKGEYLNGKRNGKGKEYYDNGILDFEGEYLDGKWNGKGKEYYDKDKLKYEGLNIWMGKGMEKEKNIMIMVN